jgi:hypothetical protein
MQSVRRLQIYIDEELDEALAVEAARRSKSKAFLIRQYVAQGLPSSAMQADDPFEPLIGKYDVEPGDSDEIVYGLSAPE